jgi:hypothetical protein
MPFLSSVPPWILFRVRVVVAVRCCACCIADAVCVCVCVCVVRVQDYLRTELRDCVDLTGWCVRRPLAHRGRAP